MSGQHVERYRLGMDGVDAFGIVFFAQYWRWHQATIEGLFEAAGHPLAAMFASGVGLPVVHAEIDYHHPLRLSDWVEATVRVVRCGDRSVEFETEFVQDGGPTVARSRTVQVATSTSMGPAAVPSWLREMAPTD